MKKTLRIASALLILWWAFILGALWELAAMAFEAGRNYIEEDLSKHHD